MTSIFHIHIHLLHMIIYTVALWLVSHCMMNKTTQSMIMSLVEKVGKKLWKASSNCKNSMGIHHTMTSLEFFCHFIKLIMSIIYGWEGWRTKLHHFNRLLGYCTHMFWVMQNSEDIQGKYYGISRLSHLTLTLLRSNLWQNCWTSNRQDGSGLRLGPVTVAPALGSQNICC